MDYIPETIHRTLRTYTKANKLLPIMYTKVYMYQIARSLSYIHSLGVCHRDIKPQNLLLNTKTHHVLLCDFGSAKVLVPGEPNVSYICSRYYRAPELVFEATQYSTQIEYGHTCTLRTPHSNSDFMTPNAHTRRFSIFSFFPFFSVSGPSAA